MQWVAWVVPSLLAAPLIALGRVQVTTASGRADLLDAGGFAPAAPMVVSTVLTIYLLGVAAVLIPTIVASIRTRRSAGRARDVGHDDDWSPLIAAVCFQLGIGRSVRVLISGDAIVPMTWGFMRPVVMLPAGARTWSANQRSIVLTHELTHVRGADWLFNLLARAICALLWFHPGAWWVARRLRDDCELACDDRVIASGVRRSDYAELLVDAADMMTGGQVDRGVAVALSRPQGLRGRLAAVLDAGHTVRPLTRGWIVAAGVVTITVAAPASVVQLAPTRTVLTTLMLDTQWESRAYAVIGLARRADSVAVARDAAELDPSPRVRAWARYALGEKEDLRELRSLLRAK
jgi:beta-lactamase regulating signal transducer with metallopeptidase domain